MMENQNQPEPQGKHLKHTHHIFLTIIVILLGILAVGYLWLQSQNSLATKADKDFTIVTSTIDTSNWKTYRNDQLGFEIKYPRAWNKISEFDNPFLLTISNYSKAQYVHGLGIPDKGGLEIRIAQGTMPVCFKISDIFILQTDPAEGGLQLYEKHICNGAFTIFLSYTDDTKYPLSLPEVNSNKKLLEEISSTFEFISKSTTDISTWKTFRNDDLGFEFKYPSNWYIDNRSKDISTVSNFKDLSDVMIDEDNESNIGYFRVLLRGNLVDQSLPQFVKELSKIGDPKPTEVIETQIAGKPAFRLKIPYPFFSGYLYLIQTDNAVFEIDYSTGTKFDSIYSQILSSFKFTK